MNTQTGMAQGGEESRERGQEDGMRGGNEKRRVMCFHRDESSTDGLPPGCLSGEIACDLM